MTVMPLSKLFHLLGLVAWVLLSSWLVKSSLLNGPFDASRTSLPNGEEGHAYYITKYESTHAQGITPHQSSDRPKSLEATAVASSVQGAPEESPGASQGPTSTGTGFKAVEGDDFPPSDLQLAGQTPAAPTAGEPRPFPAAADASTALHDAAGTAGQLPDQGRSSLDPASQEVADQVDAAQHGEMLMLPAAVGQQSDQHEPWSLRPSVEYQADAAIQQLSTDPTDDSSAQQEVDVDGQLQDVQEPSHASTEPVDRAGMQDMQDTLHGSMSAQTTAADGAVGGAAQQQQQGTALGASMAGGLSMWGPFTNLTNILDTISAQWMGRAADEDCPAGDVQHGTVCPQQDNVWQAQRQAAAAAPESCAALDAGAGPAVHLHAPMQQPQHLQEDVSTASSDVELPPGAFLTPQLIMDAYLRIGPLNSALYVLAAVLSAVLLRAACNAAMHRLFRRRRLLSGLPLSIQRNPQAQEAFFALRQLCFQKRAWWRLLGVSAVAVSKAVDADAQASSVASKARGGASFARGLLRQQQQRLQAEKAAALQQLEQELRAEAAEQQQQAAAAHASVMEGLEGEIMQHLQKQQQQSDIIRDISEERATLAAEQRQNKEAMVGLKATTSSLQQQLQESKQGHAQVRQQYEQFCKEIAKEQGWKEALKLKMDEAAGREQALASKCEGLHEQLSQANSTISHLRLEGQHKDATIAARDAACSQLESSTQQLQAKKQQLLEQHAGREQELQAQLAAEGNQHAQTRIKLQHELVQRQTAEESLRLERQEKQDLAAKADGLQAQLTSTSLELSQLNADHAAAKQTLARLQADLSELEQQHKALLGSSQAEASALQQQLSERDEQLSQQARELSDLSDKKQQVDQELQELQQQLQEVQEAAALRDIDIEQLISESEGERLRLAESQRKLQEAVTERDRARERCLVLEERVEQQQQDADLLEQQFEVQQQELVELRAKHEANRLTLQEAQRDLSIKMEQYEEEDRKNRELGAENGKLQREVAKLTEHERQLEQALEELDVLNERLVTEHSVLQESFDTFLHGAEKDAATQGATLAHITDRSQELATKLEAAEAQVSKLTQERDELSKKVYWAEMARDQTKAAKEIATEDALKARQALKEERSRYQTTPPARGGAASGGRGAVGASCAAAAAAGELSSSGTWTRGTPNSAQPAKKWGEVKPAYLQQRTLQDKHGATRRPGSPTHSHTHSNEGGSTPCTPRSTATSGDGGGDSSTPLARGRPRLRPTSSNASAAAAAAAAAAQQEGEAADGGDGGSGAAAAGDSPRRRGLSPGQAAAGSPLGSSRLRRQSAGGASTSRLQECSSSQQQQQQQQQQQEPPSQQEQEEQQQQQQQAHEQQQQPELQQQQQQGLQRSDSCGSSSSAGSTGGRAGSRPGRAAGAADCAKSSSKVCASPEDTAAAASEGLRRNFSDAGLADHGSSGSAEHLNQQQDSLPAQQPSHQQQQQHQGELSPSPEVQATPAAEQDPAAAAAAAEQPLEQGGASPSLCSNGTQSRVRGAPDMRPLALSPVQQSSDMFPMQQQSADMFPGRQSSAVRSVQRSADMSPLQHSSDLVLTGAGADSPGVSSSSSSSTRGAAAAGDGLPAAAVAEDSAGEPAAEPQADAAAAAAASFDAAAGGPEEQQQVLAALQCTAARPGLTSGPSVVSAPGTPAATAAAAAPAPAASLEGPADDLTFFTPLQANRRRSSSGSGQVGVRSSQDSAAAAAAAAGDDADPDDDASTVHGTPDPSTPATVRGTPYGEQGTPATVHGTPSTPYFTPGLAAAGAAGLAAAVPNAGGTTAAAAAAAAAAGTAEASCTPSSVADSTGSRHTATAAVRATNPTGSSNSSPDRNSSSPWLRRLPDSSAPPHSSSSPGFRGASMSHDDIRHDMGHAEDGDVVLIGSLSEADFAGLGLGVGHSGGELQGPHASVQLAHPADEQLLQLAAAADAGHEHQQQQQQEGEEEAGESHMNSSMDSSIAGTSSSTSSAVRSSGALSDDCAPAVARAAAVPRLPLFQLHTAAAAADGTAAGSSHPAQGSNSHRGLGASTTAAAAAGVRSSGPQSWQLQDSVDGEGSSLISSSGNSSSRVHLSAVAAAAAVAAHKSDAECDDGDSSLDEEDGGVLASDADTTPPRMFIGNVPPAAVAAVAAAAAGAALSPRMVQHSPRYQDQRVMHSPRYADQQQHRQQQGSEQHTVAAEARTACGSSDSEDDADADAQDDVAASDAAPRAAAAAAGDAGGVRHSSSSSSKALKPAKSPAISSPTRPASATALSNSSPPAAAAVGPNSSNKYVRGSSRLSDPASSSCSSIKSLVAHSRQQQQQLRRTGSNGSVGSAGSLGGGGGGAAAAAAARTSSVLSGGSPKDSGRASGAGLGPGVTGVTDQQVASKARRVAAAGGSPGRSIAAMVASKAAAAAAAAAAGGEQQASMQALLASTGSIGSDTGSAAAGVDSSTYSKAQGSGGVLGSSLQSWDPLLGRSLSSSSSQEQHVLSPPGSSTSPQPNAAPRATAGGSLINSSSSSSTPPGHSARGSLPRGSAAAGGPLGRGGSVGRGGLQQQQQKSRVLWQSLDDFVHAARASGSTHSSPGVGAAAAVAAPGIGRHSSAVGLPPFLSPPAASVHANPWTSPLGANTAAAAAAGPGVRGSAGSSGGSSSNPRVLKSPACPPPLPAVAAAASRACSSPQPSTPAATLQQGGEDCSTAGGATAAAAGGVPVLPVAEGVSEGPGDADSPNSMLSGGSGAEDDSGGCDGQPDAWVVQENPVYFELH